MCARFPSVRLQTERPGRAEHAQAGWSGAAGQVPGATWAGLRVLVVIATFTVKCNYESPSGWLQKWVASPRFFSKPMSRSFSCTQVPTPVLKN